MNVGSRFSPSGSQELQIFFARFYMAENK